MTTLELIERGIGHNCLADAYDLGRADAIEEYRRTLSDICCRDNYSSAYLLDLFKRIAEQLKEKI